MTTIATDGDTMACDGRGCVYDIIICESLVKIRRLEDGSLLGLAGHSHALDKLAAWLNDPRSELSTELGEWTALRVMRDGETRLYSHAGPKAWRAVDLPAAIGTGREVALGAMLGGALPEEAVKIACLRDVYSGGPVTVLEREEKK
jgi:hypothetical protein